MITGWAKPVRDWFNTGLGFVYPETCQVCKVARATPSEGYVCADCRQQTKYIRDRFCHRCGLPFEGALTTIFNCSNCADMELHFSSARAAVVSNGMVREVILRYKYQQALWFEPFLAGLLLEAAVPALSIQKPDFVVPVPLHPLKKREREFNQAERLGSHLATALAIPLNTTVLRRVSFTVTQTKLTRQERAANMRGVFAVEKNLRLNGEKVVLVDDVFTTGATTNACAKVLRAAGAAEVCVWTVARGI